MKWQWGWVPFSDGHSFGDNPVFDGVRAVCLVIGIVLVCAILRVLIEGQRRDPRMDGWLIGLFVALIGADIYICFTEFAVFGTAATPRLLVGLATLAIAVGCVRAMRRKQRATPPVI